MLGAGDPILIDQLLNYFRPDLRGAPLPATPSDLPDTHQLQIPVNPQNADVTSQFAGQELKAEPNAIEKAYQYFARDPNSLAIGPTEMGMVLNPSNVEKIAAAFSGTADASKLGLIKKFMQLKYPTIMKYFGRSIEPMAEMPENILGSNTLLPGIVKPGGAVGSQVERVFRNLTRDNLLGNWDEVDPALKVIYGNNVAKHGNINILRPQEQEFSKLADTVGHEVTHGVDRFRHPLLYSDVPDPLSYEGYAAQPKEVNARKGGETVEKAIQKFIDMKFPKFDVNKHISELPEFVDEVVRPAWAERAQYLDRLEKSVSEMGGDMTDNMKTRVLRDIKFSKDHLAYNQQMLENHLNPNWDPVTHDRNPLTAGMLLVDIYPTEAGHEDSLKYLNKFLFNRSYSGTTAPVMPTSGGSYQLQPVKLDPYKAFLNLLQ